MMIEKAIHSFGIVGGCSVRLDFMGKRILGSLNLGRGDLRELVVQHSSGLTFKIRSCARPVRQRVSCTGISQHDKTD